MENPLKEMIRQRRVALGITITVIHRAVVEVLVSAGFDWLSIDMESDLVDFECLHRLLHTTNFGKCVPLVRIANKVVGNVTRVMNSGVCGVIVGMVQTVEDVAQAVKTSKYPPLGTRSVGLDLPCGFKGDIFSYTSQANESSIVLVEIDDVVGMENLESIVTVPELDGVMLNPQVLASSMGLGMGSSHPAVREAEQRLLDATQKAGIIAGVLIAQPSPQEFTRLLKDGFLLVAYGMDVWFLVRTCAETIQHLRHIMDTARAK